MDGDEDQHIYFSYKHLLYKHQINNSSLNEIYLYFISKSHTLGEIFDFSRLVVVEKFVKYVSFWKGSCSKRLDWTLKGWLNHNVFGFLFLWFLLFVLSYDSFSLCPLFLSASLFDWCCVVKDLLAWWYCAYLVKNHCLIWFSEVLVSQWPWTSNTNDDTAV